MGYGLIKPADAAKLAWSVCDVLGGGINHCAAPLLVETSQQETMLGTFADHYPYGAGVGLCQFDQIAFVDVKRRTRASTALAIKKHWGINLNLVQHRELAFSPLLSLVFCRLFYRLIPEPIPNSMGERAQYWKRYYNTAKGKGTATDYIYAAKAISFTYLTRV